MSRLDRHVTTVQNKMMLGTFVRALAWAAVGYAALVWLVIVIERVINFSLPRPGWMLLGGGALTALGALSYAMWRRPTRHNAALAIDAQLGLKEKFSTALYVRSSRDPFAQAAVKDAERAADNVSLYKRFPLQFPRPAMLAVVLALGAFLTAAFLKPMDLFARSPELKKPAVDSRKVDDTRKFVKDQIALVEAAQKEMPHDDTLKLAKAKWEAMLKEPMTDPDHAKRSVMADLSDVNDAIKRMEDTKDKFVDAKSNEELLKTMGDAKDKDTALGQAQQDLKKGDLDAANKEISDAVSKFNNMSDAEKAKAVEQAKQLAAELAKAGNDPKVQQNIAQQLQQLGANQQQAQQMAQQMAQAAQGNPQAAQQLQKMAQQMMQQMNNGKGPTAQQKQQIAKMMAQQQGQANAQANAQAMSQAAQQMAKAMQQAQQAGSKPGQGNPQQAQQAMAQAQQQMQQQVQQMQEAANDAKQIAAAQQAAAQSAGNAAKELSSANGQGGQGEEGGANSNPGQGQQNGRGQEQQQQANQQIGNGQGPGGQRAAGGQREVAEAPADFKSEIDPTQDQGKGRMLASRFVKAPIEKGKSLAELKTVAKEAEQEEPDEVEQDRIPRDAQESVKDYFGSIQKTQ